MKLLNNTRDVYLKKEIGKTVLEIILLNPKAADNIYLSIFRFNLLKYTIYTRQIELSLRYKGKLWTYVKAN